jgi:hypothetical protein
MSQAGIVNTSSGPVPPTVATTYVTDVNSPAIPAANILNVLGNDTTENDNDGIRTDGSSGSNTLTVQLTNRLQGTATTAGATTADIVTFALGATPGTYSIEVRIAGFESTTPAGVGYSLFGSVRTTGAAASVVGTVDRINNEDAALTAATATIIASANNAIVQVTGVAGLSLNWNAVALYTFVS